MSALCTCVDNSNKDLMKVILSTHFSTTKITEFQKESLHILRRAVSKGSVDLFELLLKHSDWDFLVNGTAAGVECRSGSVKSLLGTAVDAGSTAITEMLLLLVQESLVNDSYRGKPLLHLALQQGHAHLAKRLVHLGADVNITDAKMESPLFAALSSNMKESEKNHIVRWLIKQGADISHTSSSGKQPIHTAAGHFPLAIIPLSEAGCDVNTREATQANTPLHVACSRADMLSISYLIRHGARVNCTNSLGQTPLNKLLEHACNHHDFHAKTRRSMAKVLIANGFSLSPSERKSPRNGRDKVEQLYRHLRGQQRHVPTLQGMCWLQVRSHLPGVHFERSVASLDIPKHLQVYLQCPQSF
ncbi:serine/threonine-protein phosphatase 6 regulatory ankyrin repeat subunit B-like [Gigantopelta aegis]|uniref:serine/threonine-protein phosphatase 6 regulatory ankyrin repeat subunit B-like n=1 Tax=Gigantopelta aegis TaxID=1735272 RepID=UPI001B8879A0|nr:serine/threonine-protein phosphatase 6 regulatory ankyrin repeat subunit B-like [Gigantopelta aegis]